jgi:hypothetical protein
MYASPLEIPYEDRTKNIHTLRNGACDFGCATWDKLNERKGAVIGGGTGVVLVMSFRLALVALLSRSTRAQAGTHRS